MKRFVSVVLLAMVTLLVGCDERPSGPASIMITPKPRSKIVIADVKATLNGVPIEPTISPRKKQEVKQSGDHWRQQDGIVYFSVTSDGTTGEQWIERLEKKGLRVGSHAKGMLRSKDFHPTSGVTTEIAVLRGTLFDSTASFTKQARIFAAEHRLETPNAEVACMIREAFSNEEIETMGLEQIAVMHRPINTLAGVSSQFIVDNQSGRSWLGNFYDGPGSESNPSTGAAFAIPFHSATTQPSTN